MPDEAEGVALVREEDLKVVERLATGDGGLGAVSAVETVEQETKPLLWASLFSLWANLFSLWARLFSLWAIGRASFSLWAGLLAGD